MADLQKKKPPEDPEKVKMSRKMKLKVDNLLKVTDVLTGKDIPEGKIGDKIRAQKQLELSLEGGKKIRDKKFKKFDEWLLRAQRLNNEVKGENRKDVPRVEIKRQTFSIKNNQGKGEVI